MKVFLGGTCGNSKWRDLVIPMLKIDYYNPVVPDWTSQAQEEERRQRTLCDFCLYVITPQMQGVYAIAEAVDDSNKCPERTVFCLIFSDNGLQYTDPQKKSLIQVYKLIRWNGGKTFMSLLKCVDYLNKFGDASNE